MTNNQTLLLSAVKHITAHALKKPVTTIDKKDLESMILGLISTKNEAPTQFITLLTGYCLALGIEDYLQDELGNLRNVLNLVIELEGLLPEDGSEPEEVETKPTLQ